MNSASAAPRARIARSALVIAAIGCAVLAGCSDAISGQAVRDPAAAPIDVPPLQEDQLDDLLLPIDEINEIVGSDILEVGSDLDQMSDFSRGVSDLGCLGAVYGAEQQVYGDSGYTAVRDQLIDEPGDDGNDHWVQQTVVLYPSAEEAQRFFADSQSVWDGCAGGSVDVEENDMLFTFEVGDLTATDTLLTQVTVQADGGGWECQHALGFVSNLTVEGWACAFGAGEEAAEIVTRIVDKAAG